jgi:hypothetical protein
MRKRFDDLCNKNKCTCWFDGIDSLGIHWGDCCEEHDQDIIQGRTKSSFEADRKLCKCVASKSKVLAKIIAVIMWIGVTPMAYFAWKGYRKGKLK